MIDTTFLPIARKARRPAAKPIERYIVLTDAAHMPATPLRNAVPYEEWLAEADGDFAWKTFDENTAAGMCYTSGTTGNPKGVLYSHRSNVLHSMMAAQADAMGICSRDVIMPVVPMFHANCWGLALDLADDRRHHGDAGRQARRRLDLRVARQVPRHLHAPPCRRSG